MSPPQTYHAGPLQAAGLGVAPGVSPARRHHRCGLAGSVQPELRRGSDHPGGPDREGVWVISIRENIDTRVGSAGEKFYRRMMMAQGVYQADSTKPGMRARSSAAIRPWTKNRYWRPSGSTLRTRRSAVRPRP